MYLRFLHDAEASIRHGYHEKAILELAMACEIYLRYSVSRFIPVGTPKELATYIEEANINQYISKFFKSLIPNERLGDYKRLAKDLSSLMSRRNTYVHMGHMDGANLDHCRRYTKAAKSLFAIRLPNEPIRT
jgi:hypothetical protein